MKKHSRSRQKPDSRADGAGKPAAPGSPAGPFLVNIENLAFGGDGVGTVSAPGSELDGIRCFVPFSAPGDQLEVTIKKRSPSFVRGEIAKILQPSPLRTDPPCPLFGRCGGCSWQHLEYPAQTTAKREILQQNLLRLGGIALDVPPPVPSPEIYGYRSRLRMKVSDSGILAFTASGSRELVETEHCPVASGPLNRFIRSAASGELQLPRGAALILQIIDGQVHWSRENGAIGFYQANGAVNDLLKKEISGLAGLGAGAGAGARAAGGAAGTDAGAAAGTGNTGAPPLRLLDLFCGNGNLSLPLAAKGAEVAGFDTNGQSVAEAQRAADAAAGGAGASYTCMDALKAAREIAEGKIAPFGNHPPDIMLLDPPRAGVGSSGIRDICTIGAARIIYISCDPATLSRDLKEAVQSGYQVESVQLFDMFPQTSHFETLALLQRK